MAAATNESRLLGYAGLFTSFGTLVCCALPSLLVLLGFGATVASFLSAVPWLVGISRHKEWVFTFAALLIAGNYFYVYRIVPRLLVERGTCPANDPAACARATRMSRTMLWLSLGVFVVGAAVAFVLPVMLERMDG